MMNLQLTLTLGQDSERAWLPLCSQTVLVAGDRVGDTGAEDRVVMERTKVGVVAGVVVGVVIVAIETSRFTHLLLGSCATLGNHAMLSCPSSQLLCLI